VKAHKLQVSQNTVHQKILWIKYNDIYRTLEYLICDKRVAVHKIMTLEKRWLEGGEEGGKKSIQKCDGKW
jgi:hypothetical protein